MGLLQFFCHFIDDSAYRERFVTAALTGERLKELRRHELSPQQIGMVLREDKVGLINELFAEIAAMDLSTRARNAEPAAASLTPRSGKGKELPPQKIGRISAAAAQSESLRTIVQWPGPVAVAIENVTPVEGSARKRHEMIVRGWHFAQRVEFEFHLKDARVRVKPKWVHVGLTGESWAAVNLSFPKKGRWAITASNLTGEYLPYPVSTSLPAAFEAR
jgi:hypothetical protein